jgi:predicted MFS family arabinose efflux permease
MFSRRLKTGYFALEGLNSFATVYYFYYLYFYMQQAHGFGNKDNLLLAALNGGTYAAAAWFGGRFGQRQGYFKALKVGYSVMILALSLGLAVRSAAGHIAVMVLTVVGMSFTWPTLEALVSEGEPRSGLQHMVGIYNVVWAGTAALANFSGGAMLQNLGLASLFYVPIGIHVTQLSLTIWLEQKATRSLAQQMGSTISRATQSGPAAAVGAVGSSLHAEGHGVSLSSGSPSGNGRQTFETPKAQALDAGTFSRGSIGPGADPAHGPEHGVPLVKAKRFLQMAWLANPFAYIAINTLIAVVPGVARRLELTTMAAGFCCSIWCFARLGTFAFLWQWAGWHYRFRWLLVAYGMLVASFGSVVLAPTISVLVLAQLLFGGSVGLIYYSSLFYSMDCSDTKGEHGGIHEAVIGLGNCAGPAAGALALQLLPGNSQSGTIAVIALLLCGLGGLIGIWKRQPLTSQSNR